VLTRVVEIVLRPHFGRRRMVYLERFNLLAEIGGVSADMDYIANPQRTALGRDGEVAVLVSHDADALLRRIRSRARGRRRPGLESA
ncbi:MAG: hypothetical protein WCF56_06195, partial [Pseudolabrys sp.]